MESNSNNAHNIQFHIPEELPNHLGWAVVWLCWLHTWFDWWLSSPNMIRELAFIMFHHINHPRYLQTADQLTLSLSQPAKKKSQSPVVPQWSQPPKNGGGGCNALERAMACCRSLQSGVCTPIHRFGKAASGRCRRCRSQGRNIAGMRNAEEGSLGLIHLLKFEPTVLDEFSNIQWVLVSCNPWK